MYKYKSAVFEKKTTGESYYIFAADVLCQQA